jgi:hypothetical protein
MQQLALPPSEEEAKKKGWWNNMSLDPAWIPVITGFAGGLQFGLAVL